MARSFQEPLEAIFATSRPYLLRVGRRLCKGDARYDAEDLVQDVFLSFMKAFQDKTLPAEAACLAWLATALTNAFISQVRKVQVSVRVQTDPVFNESVISFPVPTMPKLSEIITEDELAEAVRALSEKLREAVKASIKGKCYDDIAKELGIRRGTVAKRLHDARRQLRETLEANHPE